jgi:hypothetical protein
MARTGYQRPVLRKAIQRVPKSAHATIGSRRYAWQNAFVERFIGSVRRECLDHVIVFNEAGLVRLMTLYRAYYEQSRTHLSLEKDAPIPRPVMPASDGAVVVAVPEVGGLHREYLREEQHSQPGCIARRMQLDFRHGLLRR